MRTRTLFIIAALLLVLIAALFVAGNWNDVPDNITEGRGLSQPARSN